MRIPTNRKLRGLASSRLALPLVAFVYMASLLAQVPEGSTYVYRCTGEQAVIVVSLNEDRGYLFSRQVSQPIWPKPGTTAYAGNDVYYLPDQSSGLASGQSAEITIAGRKYAYCKNNPRAAVWEAAKLRGVSYRAVGQEPPWVLEIDREKGFLLVTDYGQDEQRFPYREPVSDSEQRTGRYSSELNGERLLITIKGDTCRDSMSGEVFDSQVEIDWRDRTLRGCGRALH